MRMQLSVLIGAALLLAVITGTSMVASQTKSVQIITPSKADGSAEPRPVRAETTKELQELFASLDYQWPPADLNTVPAVVLQSLPKDLGDLHSVSERKSLFLRSLLPIVLLENQRLREQRALLQLIMIEGLPPEGSQTLTWLRKTARQLRVRGDLSDPKVQQRMLNRLDEIPLALALAQGAIESGWGTSRFAREGNSLFGQWTYNTKNGLEPSDRDEDANHLVEAFQDLQASVRAYMRNLNTSRAYREFRDTRAGMRADGEDLSAVELAQHLHRYSQRGVDYVKELQRMINSRTLAVLDQLPLPTEPLRMASLPDKKLDRPS